MMQALSMLILLLEVCTSNSFNLEACSKDHEIWLWPEIERGWNLYTGQEVPYQQESDSLGR